ncbi:MAG: hypothetical protein ABI895_22535 [Deltaproteobacteria bacterium]
MPRVKENEKASPLEELADEELQTAQGGLGTLSILNPGGTLPRLSTQLGALPHLGPVLSPSTFNPTVILRRLNTCASSNPRID